MRLRTITTLALAILSFTHNLSSPVLAQVLYECYPQYRRQYGEQACIQRMHTNYRQSYETANMPKTNPVSTGTNFVTAAVGGSILMFLLGPFMLTSTWLAKHERRVQEKKNKEKDNEKNHK